MISNHRGCESKFTKQNFTLHTDIDTIQAVIKHVKSMYKVESIFLVGIS